MWSRWPRIFRTDVVVGKVLDVAPHPNADRLSVCAVDVGKQRIPVDRLWRRQCPAGEHYPVAMIGATLPGGLKIKRSKLRGEVSEGMLCSASNSVLPTRRTGFCRSVTRQHHPVHRSPTHWISMIVSLTLI